MKVLKDIRTLNYACAGAIPLLLFPLYLLTDTIDPREGREGSFLSVLSNGVIDFLMERIVKLKIFSYNKKEKCLFYEIFDYFFIILY